MEQRVETSDRTVGNFVLFWMPHHYSYHLSCISHEINNFQSCFVQGRNILHFIDLLTLRRLQVMTSKKMMCQDGTFILIVGGSFVGKCLWWIWDRGCIIPDRSNERGAAEKGSSAKSQHCISCRFYFLKSEWLRKGRLRERIGGELRRDDTFPSWGRGSPSDHFGTIWHYFYARGKMTVSLLFTVSDDVSVGHTSLFCSIP